MKFPFVFVALVALTIIAGQPLLGFIANITSKAVVRYRLDVTFKVDGKPVKGSVVQQLVLYGGGGDGKGTIAATVSHVSGQALMLKLPGRPALRHDRLSFCSSASQSRRRRTTPSRLAHGQIPPRKVASFSQITSLTSRR